MVFQRMLKLTRRGSKTNIFRVPAIAEDDLEIILEPLSYFAQKAGFTSDIVFSWLDPNCCTKDFVGAVPENLFELWFGFLPITTRI